MENKDYPLASFRADLINDVLTRASNESSYPYQAFYDEIEDDLEASNDIIELKPNYFQKTRNEISKPYRPMHIDMGNVSENDGSLSLGVVNFNPGEMRTVLQSDLDNAAKGMEGFLYNCLKRYFQNEHLEAEMIFGLAADILGNLDTMSTVNLYLFTTDKLSNRITTISRNDFDDGNGHIFKVNFEVYDIQTFYELHLNLMPKKNIDIDILIYRNEGIPCLHANLDSSDYDAYLAIVPGDFLSNIYRDYGGKLLEKNVRSFLSARGNINKGIRKTILTEPEKFFTYNNGIACTADSVETTTAANGALLITKMNNFQIINGGQTTASLRNAILTSHGQNVELNKIFVSMKLTILSPSLSTDKKEELVSCIATYANTQNKVSKSDLRSNNQFYQRFKELSTKTQVPFINNQPYHTYWFFERTRGEYERDQMEKTQAERKNFKLSHPNRMKKTDLAKYVSTFELRPYDVVWGSEVTNERFLRIIDDQWNKDDSVFNEVYFKKSVAYAIIFQSARKLIGAAPWYQANSGILAEVVPYTLAKMQYDVSQLPNKRAIDFKQVWNDQKISTAMEDTILKLGHFVMDVLINKKQKPNVAEWCKLKPCWEGMKAEKFTYSDEFLNSLVSQSDEQVEQVAAKKEAKRSKEVDIELMIYNKGQQYWQDLIDVGTRDHLLSSDDVSFLQSAVNIFITGRLPSIPQQKAIWKIRQRLIDQNIAVLEPDEPSNPE